MYKKVLLISALASCAVLLSGCAAIGTAIKHRNLQTQALMSKSIFLDPVPQREKTVFVQVHNTTDKASFDLMPELTSDLLAKGYRIKQDPTVAHYVLQVNVLRVGRASRTAANEMMGMGYGGALEGGGAGVALAAIGDASGAGIVGAGLAGAIVGTVADNLVQDVHFAGVVDLKITEKKLAARHGHKVYKTRIAVTADKVNLKFAEAQPKLEHDIATSISGLF
ncbi:MAG: complement resistance protein TraT [Robiginitomaculum sp.]|nr:complement resistance protein TraT [Robiginitomaculum sp.]